MASDFDDSLWNELEGRRCRRILDMGRARCFSLGLRGDGFTAHGTNSFGERRNEDAGRTK